MNQDMKELRHDLINSIVIINSLSKTIYKFVDQISVETLNNSQKKIELLKNAVTAIQNETSNIEFNFLAILKKLED